MSAVALLREHTHAAHETVDAAFAHFDLADRPSYRDFLVAHARALPVAEAIAAQVATFRARTPLLADDLAALGASFPTPLPAPPADDAAAWGALYVLEGSRLGGRLLAAQVASDLPAAYLGAIHEPGEWRATRQSIDDAAAPRDGAWRARMIAGAMACFDLYRDAARST